MDYQMSDAEFVLTAFILLASTNTYARESFEHLIIDKSGKQRDVAWQAKRVAEMLHDLPYDERMDVERAFARLSTATHTAPKSFQ